MTSTIRSITTHHNFSMPVFGIGTWKMGGGVEHDPNNDDERDITGIKQAIEKGITHIDTAEMYAAGHSEELVGEAIKGADRSSLFLVSKVSPQHLSYDDVLRSAVGSLKRLETDYLDLYLIHKPNPDIAIEETMKALNRLKNEGLIKHIGVSNFSTERLQAAQNVSEHPIVANQLHYNVSVREIEDKGVLQYCQEQDIVVIAWRPIMDIPALEAAPILKELSDKYQKTPIQIAINWLIAQKNVVTLTKCSHMEHLEENMAAIGWSMEKEDVERIRKEYPHQQMVSDAVPLI